MFFFLTELFYLFIFYIVEVKTVLMSASMKQYAVDSATQAYIRYNSTLDIALYIKNEFNNRYGQHWQCIVGSSFSYYVRYKLNHMIFLKLDQNYILLFKAT